MIVAAATSDANGTYSASLDSRPDAVILSSGLPGGAVNTIVRIRAELPRTEFVVMADRPDEELMLQVVAAGAHGFLLGETDPARVPNAVAGVLNGEAAFPRRLVRMMADELARCSFRRQVLGASGAGLTNREAEVLEALVDGMSVRLVAADLGITAATVRRHAARATAKLGAPSRDAAVDLVRGRRRGPGAIERS